MFGPNFPQSSFFDRRWAFDIRKVSSSKIVRSTKYLPAAGRQCTKYSKNGRKKILVTFLCIPASLREEKKNCAQRRKGATSQSLRKAGLSSMADLKSQSRKGLRQALREKKSPQFCGASLRGGRDRTRGVLSLNILRSV